MGKKQKFVVLMNVLETNMQYRSGISARRTFENSD